MAGAKSICVGPITLIGKSLGYSMRDSDGGIASIYIPIKKENRRRQRDTAGLYCSQFSERLRFGQLRNGLLAGQPLQPRQGRFAACARLVDRVADRLQLGRLLIR